MARLAAAALCAVLGAALYLAVVHVPVLASADLRTLEGFMGMPGARHAYDLVQLFNPVPFALIAGSVVVAAVLAGRTRAAAVAGLTMLGAGVTTQLLKPLLATQREFPPGHFMGPVAFPSGHTTAVMSLSLALVIVSTPRLRPYAVAAGGVLTVAVVFSLLVLGSHYPSDVAGGLLVATGWACLASAALRLELSPSLRGAALGAAVLAALGLAAVAWRPWTLAYAASNTTFVAGALAIAAGALVLSGSVPAPRAALRRRSSPRARG